MKIKIIDIFSLCVSIAICLASTSVLAEQLMIPGTGARALYCSWADVASPRWTAINARPTLAIVAVKSPAAAERMNLARASAAVSHSSFPAIWAANGSPTTSQAQVTPMGGFSSTLLMFTLPCIMSPTW